MAILLPMRTKISLLTSSTTRKLVPGMKYMSRRRSPWRSTSSIKCLKHESIIDGIRLAPKSTIRQQRVRWRSRRPYLPEKDGSHGDLHGGVYEYLVQAPAVYEEHAR
jgi:hypothetical protein